MPRARPHRRAARRGRGLAVAPALGGLGVGPAGAWRPVRRHGVVAALRGVRRARPAGPAAGGRAGAARRAAPHPRPGCATARRGGGAGRDAGRDVGGEGGRRGSPSPPARPLRALAARLPGPCHDDAPRPRGPAIPALGVRRFDPVAGDPARLAAGVSRLVGDGYAVTLCAATGAGADAAERHPW